MVVLVGASFLPLWFIWESAERFNSLDVLSEAMNAWVRGVGTAVACLMLLGVAVRASGGVSGERERQTFDALLTCPLESRDILAGKWLGSLLAMRWTWLWLGAIWLLGLVSGGLHPLALPLLALAWFAFAAFVAALGLWYSTVCPNTLRATLWTLFALVVVWAAHWLAWMCCIPVFIVMGPGGGGRELEQVLPRVAEFQAFTLTPPATLGFLAFRLKDFEHFDNYASTNWAAEWLVCALLGIAGWGAAAAVLRSATLERFDQVTGRRAVRRRPPPGR